MCSYRKGGKEMAKKEISCWELWSEKEIQERTGRCARGNQVRMEILFELMSVHQAYNICGCTFSLITV